MLRFAGGLTFVILLILSASALSQSLYIDRQTGAVELNIYQENYEPNRAGIEVEGAFSVEGVFEYKMAVLFADAEKNLSIGARLFPFAKKTEKIGKTSFSIGLDYIDLDRKIYSVGAIFFRKMTDKKDKDFYLHYGLSLNKVTRKSTWNSKEINDLGFHAGLHYAFIVSPKIKTKLEFNYDNYTMLDEIYTSRFEFGIGIIYGTF